MSKEETKFLMKALWESITSAPWTKDSLIEFGKVVFTKASLKEMPEKSFTTLFPFLKSMTESLGTKLSDEAERRGAEETSSSNVSNDEQAASEKVEEQTASEKVEEKVEEKTEAAPA